MKKIVNRFLLSLILLGSVTALYSSTKSDIVINEILIDNIDNVVNPYGVRSGWIEFFNPTYGTVNLEGHYLTNDPNNLTKHFIPKGDPTTIIRPREYLVLWADGEPTNGTLHLSFKLDESSELILVSSDGRTILDRVTIPHSKLGENISYGRVADGAKEWTLLPYASPKANNAGEGEEPGWVRLSKIDPNGVVMTVTAMSIVFMALLLLFLIFKWIGVYNVRLSKERTAKATGRVKGESCPACDEVPGEVYAAIATALFTFEKDEEIHDIEDTILTISKVTRNYSPWSSKIYTLRETPNKK